MELICVLISSCLILIFMLLAFILRGNKRFFEGKDCDDLKVGWVLVIMFIIWVPMIYCWCMGVLNG